MKKGVIAALFLAAALLLAACGGPEEVASTSTPTPSATFAPVAGAAPTPTAPPFATPPGAYGTPVPAEVGFTFTRQNMPRLDGSADLAWVAQAVCSAVLRENREEAADLVQFHATTTAYYNLLWGYADLLLVGESDGNVKEEKESRDFQWEKEPFALDALVFVMAEEDPVSSVTLKNLGRLFSGEITNWRTLKAGNREVIPVVCGAGESLAWLEKAVLNGAAPEEAPWQTVGSVEELAQALLDAGAIGCCTYCDWSRLEDREGLKLLAVGNAVPSGDAIRAGRYPLRAVKYAVIPAAAPEEAASRILFDWLLGEEGQRLAAAEGYVPMLKAAESAS